MRRSRPIFMGMFMKKLYEKLCKIEEYFCAAGLLFLVFFILLSALLRAFKVSQSWYIDLAMLVFAWTAFLGADVAWRKGQILGVDLFTRTLPKVGQRIIELVIYLIILATLAVIFVYGIRLAWTDRLSTYQSMPIPSALVTFSLVVASFSMIFSTIQKIVNTVSALAGKGDKK